jgi:hypothetical protein
MGFSTCLSLLVEEKVSLGFVRTNNELTKRRNDVQNWVRIAVSLVVTPRATLTDMPLRHEPSLQL